MKIQSNFNDYYDGLQYYYGGDAYYKRVLNNLELSSKHGNLTHLPINNNRFKLDEVFDKEIASLNKCYKNKRKAGILIVGEKVIPFIMIKEIKEVIPSLSQFGGDTTITIFRLEDSTQKRINFFQRIKLIYTRE